jgi:hypothetical protein
MFLREVKKHNSIRVNLKGDTTRELLPMYFFDTKSLFRHKNQNYIQLESHKSSPPD